MALKLTTFNAAETDQNASALARRGFCGTLGSRTLPKLTYANTNADPVGEIRGPCDTRFWDVGGTAEYGQTIFSHREPEIEIAAGATFAAAPVCLEPMGMVEKVGVGLATTVGAHVFLDASIVLEVLSNSGFEMGQGCHWRWPTGPSTRIHVTESGELPQPLVKRLQKLSQLSEGWDGYGARPISAAAIERAKSMLKRVSDIAGTSFAGLAFIAPCSDGGLQLEWDAPDGSELILEIPASQEPVGYLLAETSTAGKETETEGVISKTGDLRKLVLRVNARFFGELCA